MKRKKMKRKTELWVKCKISNKGKIELLIDDESFPILSLQAMKDGLTIEEMARKIIEEGMKNEMENATACSQRDREQASSK